MSLKPFLLRLREGFLLGMAMDPQKGAPCAGCYELWLKSRNVWAEPAEISELPVRHDLLAELATENSAHVCYEITKDGTTTRMDNAVFPHPDCHCDRKEYVAPENLNKKTNFAFSPFFQIKCARFGTPDGNLWLTSAYGESPLSRTPITVYGVEQDKEISRRAAIDEWFKKAALSDLQVRLQRGERLPAEKFPVGEMQWLSQELSVDAMAGGMGVGANREEATLDALVTLAKHRTLKQYASSMKNPMLIVGANNWLRTRVPFFLLQQYDLHLLFYPNSMNAWVVGLAAFSRQKVEAKPLFVFGANIDITAALNEVIFRILATCRPGEWVAESENQPDPQKSPQKDPRAAHAQRLNMWWTHWIYRCPKISLKDVLHLEAYGKSIEDWKAYFRDGQDPFSVVGMNHDLLPGSFRSIVKLQLSPADSVAPRRNINGIGTWSDFRDSL